MKVTARPLKGDPFDLEVQAEDDVEAVRAKVAAALPEFTVQKLVYAGRVLAAGSLQEAGVKDGDTLVVMTKPKAAATPAPEPEAAPVPPPAAPQPPPVPATSSTDGGGGGGAVDQAMAAGGGFEATVSQLCEMGFPRAQVEACVRAAFGNADRAVEYLMGGIPPSVMNQQQAPAPPPGPTPPAAAPGGPTPPAAPPQQPAGGFGGGMPPNFPGMFGAPPAQAAGPLAPVLNHRKFMELRMAVQHNPQILNHALSQMAAIDPNFITLIAEHQEEFVQALQQPMPGGQDAMAAMLAAAQAAQAQQQQQGGMPPAPAPPAAPAPPPQLTAAEQEAIGRLEALGFDRRMATQAYLSCNKNEELAADMLFRQMEE